MPTMRRVMLGVICLSVLLSLTACDPVKPGPVRPDIVETAKTVDVVRLRYVPIPPALLDHVRVRCFTGSAPITNRGAERCIEAHSAADDAVNARLDRIACLQGTEPETPAAAACAATIGDRTP